MHDHNIYDGVVHIQEERITRKKHNISRTNPHDAKPTREFFEKYFLPKYKERNNDHIIAFTYSNLGKEFTNDLLENLGNFDEYFSFKPTNLWDYIFKDNVYYVDHHQSHAVYSFLSSGFSDADILAIDGRGPLFSCIFIDKHGNIIDLTSKLSIGGFWNVISQQLGFGYLGAGKLMGLAGYGKFNEEFDLVIKKYLETPNHKPPENFKQFMSRVSKEDIAYTLQKSTLELIKHHVLMLKTSDNICLSGGVAYNGYVNEEMTKIYKKVHVPPAIGDEGQSLGTYMHADLILNKNTHIPNVYSGPMHDIDTTIFNDLNWSLKPFDEIYKEIALDISEGKIVGWFQGRSESGNRALGNRSILADPRNPNIKNIINSTIKKREDFRPFAPSVMEEYYKEYFETNQPSPYMSRIVPVISNAIPGVTHVDKTARIQTVNRNFNEKFYLLIEEFFKRTGIPMLLNTSFNCQEPIVETPEEAVNTFINTELDVLVINNYVIRKND